MTLTQGVVVFMLIWWTALFVVLPIGVRPNPSGEAAGGWRGAPRRVRLVRIALLNTGLTAVIWLVLHFVISADVLSFRSGWLAMPNN